MTAPSVQKDPGEVFTADTRCFFRASGGSRAAAIAPAHVLRLFCVGAEHSTHLTAFIPGQLFSGGPGGRGLCLFWASFSLVEESPLRSTGSPHARKESSDIVISGTRFPFTFSNEDGETTEKHTRKAGGGSLHRTSEHASPAAPLPTTNTLHCLHFGNNFVST